MAIKLAGAPLPSFAVPDIDAAHTFYRDVLGLTVETTEMGLLALEVGDGHRVLVYPKPDHQPAVFTVLHLPVADLDAAVDELAGQGVDMLRYDGFGQDERGVSRTGRGPDIAWFTDPAGNVVAVLQEN